MGLPSTGVWEVRSTGADTNGGGFDSAASGTDYSQQAAAQFSGTDLASANGTTNPSVVTSASHNFVATDVGNFIQVTAGTNWSTGFYEIVSVAANAATLDRAVGTSAALSNGTWAEGGALATPNKAITSMVDGNKTWIQLATYSRTTTISIPNTSGNYGVEGYQTARGDGPAGSNRPVITSATNSVTLMTYPTNATWYFKNLIFSHTAATRGHGFDQTNSGYSPSYFFYNCKFSGCKDAVHSGTSITWDPLYFENCEIASSTNIGIEFAGSGSALLHLVDSIIHDSTSDGVHMQSNVLTLVVERSIFYKNGGSGITIAASGGNVYGEISNSAFASNTADGFTCSVNNAGINMLAVQNTIFDSNGGWGININLIPTPRFIRTLNCAYNNNTSGSHQWAAGPNAEAIGDIGLTGSPFNNPGSGDFSLNTTPGAGGACVQAGFPGSLAYGGSGTLDVGPLQSAGSVINTTNVFVNQRRTIYVQQEGTLE